jgi:release factor glutamine methyltransferase
MTIREAERELLFQLNQLYDQTEAASVVNLVMENITGQGKMDRIINKNVPLSTRQLDLIESYSEKLKTKMPVQYALHEAWFCDMKFYVDEGVLIPRPETEELVNLIVVDFKDGKHRARDGAPEALPDTRTPNPVILDVGSGSGCIAIALKKKLKDVSVYSCDISSAALQVAKRNAITYQTDIHFVELDFLNKSSREDLPSCNTIVSNPPYIPLNEKSSLPIHVKDFEPHTALFVQDRDPFIFYSAIADFALEKLLSGGSIYTEIHEDFFLNVKELFLSKGFPYVRIHKDMNGKSRIVKATMLP